MARKKATPRADDDRPSWEKPWQKKAPADERPTQKRLQQGGREKYRPAPLPSDGAIDAVLARIKAARPNK